MATLLELANLRSDTRYEDLVRKVLAAAGKRAVTLAELASPTANQIAWSKEYLANPRNQADEIINYVISDNATATVDAIMTASDSTIEAAVNAAIDNLLVK